MKPSRKLLLKRFDAILPNLLLPLPIPLHNILLLLPMAVTLLIANTVTETITILVIFDIEENPDTALIEKIPIQIEIEVSEIQKKATEIAIKKGILSIETCTETFTETETETLTET